MGVYAFDVTGCDIPQLYKIVAPDGAPLNGGSGAWPLPQGDQPGDWRRVDGDIVPCSNGLHLTDARNVQRWAPSDPLVYVIYRAEYRGAILHAGDKYVVGEARLLPHDPNRPPPPDLNAAATKRDRAYARAERKLNRIAPFGQRDYLASIGNVNLPAGHPLRSVAAAMIAARKECRDAMARADAAYEKVKRAYQTAILP